MGSSIWNKIAEDFEIAKQCLWAQDNKSGWHRDQDKGLYYMMEAYYLAITAEEKDNLLYARILMMVHFENPSRGEFEYTHFNKYVAPAKAAFDAAVLEGKKPTEKELEMVSKEYAYLKYVIEKTDGFQEEIEFKDIYDKVSELGNGAEFSMCDSKPIYFEHDTDMAILKLKNEYTTVTLSFRGVLDITVSCDPLTDYVSEAYLYPCYGNKNRVCFDIGSYVILCESVEVINVEVETPEKELSKYGPLWKWIKSNKKADFNMSFDEIENILGFPIDHSFLKAKKELYSFGFEVGKISTKDKTVSFIAIDI